MTELDPEMLPGPLGSTKRMLVSPDGLKLACLTETKVLVIWDLAQRVMLATHPLVDGIGGWAWASDESLYLGRWHGFDEVDALTGATRGSWEYEDLGWVAELVRQDDMVVVVGSKVAVWLQDGEVLTELGPWNDDSDWIVRPERVDLHPDGSCVALAFDEFGLVLGRDGAELARTTDARSLRFSADGNWLLHASYREATLTSWPDMSSSRRLAFRVTDAISTSFGWLGWDHESAVLFDEEGAELWSTRYYDGIEALVGRGRRFYTASQMQWIGVRDVETGDLLTLLPAGGGRPATALAFDESGQHVVVADDGGRVTVWDFESRRACGMVDTSSLQGDEAALEVASLRFVEALWVRGRELNLMCGQHYRWPDVTSEELGSTAPSVFEQRLQSMSPDREFALHEDYEASATFLVRLSDGERVTALPPYDRHDERVEIEAEGRRLLFINVAGEGTTLRLWDVESARYEQELYVDLPLDHATFAPDGAIVGWLSTDPVYDWDQADDDRQYAPGLFFQWQPQTGDVMRWFDAPEGADYHQSVQFGDGEALFGERAPALLLDLDGLGIEPLTSTEAHRATLHAGTGRIAIALEHGVLLMIDRRAGTRWLGCTTADGSTWALQDATFEFAPSPWVAR